LRTQRGPCTRGSLAPLGGPRNPCEQESGPRARNERPDAKRPCLAKCEDGCGGALLGLIPADREQLAGLDGRARVEGLTHWLAAALEILLALHGALDVGAGQGLLELFELLGLELDVLV